MKSSLLTIKTDFDTKEELKSFAKEIGVPITAVVNMLIKQVLRDRSIIISASLRPTPYLEKIIREVEKDYEAGENITRVTNKIELEKYLETL